MKKILIIDEKSFSLVCSAILELEGHRTEILKDFESILPRLNNEFGLIITSYPFSYPFFEEIKKSNLPTIILIDHINKDLLNLLEDFNNSYCLIKPLDYQEFKSLVKLVANYETSHKIGYKIL
jgi:DNA-binding NtrC family response regulator